MKIEQLNFLNALHKSGASIKLKMPLRDGGNSIIEIVTQTIGKYGNRTKLLHKAKDSTLTMEMDHTSVSINDLLIKTTEGLKPLYYRGQRCIAFDGLAHYFYLDYQCELPPIGSIIADIRDRDISSKKRIHQIFSIIDHMDPIKIDEGYLSKLTDITEFNIKAIFVHNEDGEKLAGFMDGSTLHYYNSASNIGRTLVRIIPIKYN